jgi:hypothetical protein
MKSSFVEYGGMCCVLAHSFSVRRCRDTLSAEARSYGSNPGYARLLLATS